MICINCCAATESLYVVYSNNHIQLTDCSRCHDVVDKYIEIDNVILFIDLLLLKPGAYRHLVYNSLEINCSKYKPWKPLRGAPLLQQPRLFRLNLRNWLQKYDTLNRLWVLLIAFEIYLKWINEESKMAQHSREGSDQGCIAKLGVFHWDIFHQYMFFALYSLLDISIFHYSLQFCIIGLCGWGRDIKLAKHIMSYTTLLSYGAKIFPILTIIWPYDTLLSMNIIQWVANLYVVESLKIVTNLSYFKIVTAVVATALLRTVTVKPLLFLFLTGCNYQQWKTCIASEGNFLLRNLEIPFI
ncbi:sterol homeostasis protein ARV1 KNAG_0A02640 [Huiozyma naganishii CBS 8797]|uniref:Protein ARV n=1 Tax=Huiozyma naganishii (strain ATCC MYA-139 / BCRC 22969 / CBS 8797 / KCTC 17520 / NBRC 10181 / NCYC 3082 / Yp74L-3) TaxID=1071383 RepID=J7REG7_HUIN7|nr:hypothetical protein KNAG_0A02640 [Kazachstania naganishii CBS 8797]CCK67953.1 hypothetical protein KNAG_0A02640 [Kazachstania naganishii CBS 8797]